MTVFHAVRVPLTALSFPEMVETVAEVAAKYDTLPSKRIMPFVERVVDYLVSHSAVDAAEWARFDRAISLILGKAAENNICNQVEYTIHAIQVLAKRSLHAVNENLKPLFILYPQESKGWFSYWTKEEALNAKTGEDWLKFMVHYKEQDYHFRYYLMNYHGESCSSSRAKWIKMREMLGLPKAY